MTLDPIVLLLVLFGTLLVAGVVVATSRGLWQRLLVLGIFSGLCLYSGVGIAYSEVPDYYLFYYFGFLGAFALTFWLSRVVFVNLSIRSGRALTRVLSNVDRHPAWPLVIWTYLLLNLVPLIYPDLLLHKLFTPQAPDLTTVWAVHWGPQEMDILQKLVNYGQVLLTPFFYIALFRYRQRISRVVLISALLLYIQYVAESYVGRGVVVMMFATIWLGLWVAHPKHRRALIGVGMVAVPLALMSSYFYGVIRIGGTPRDITLVQAVIQTLEDEISFPRKVGVPIIESGVRVNLAAYGKWMLTLPIPKLLTGEIEGARINYEISEVVMGLPRGERGWYVALPGLVTESVYIYGRHFFWLHAVFIAFIATLVVRLVERTPQLLFLQAFVVVTFAYHLNRGGISGPLGVLVNHFMLFYLFVLVHVFGMIRRRWQVGANQRQAARVNQGG